ncbi:MAG: hypothetical protein MK193_09185 [Lentisphaeria bacterium]|nr:hypothetical protein [Lentisphaeria bacterium]
MNKIVTSFILVGALLLSSCIEQKDQYLLNPDGSGKVQVTITRGLPMNFQFGDSEEKSPEEDLKAFANKVLSESQGIDAWTKVSYKFLDDGRAQFKGVAYFKDLSQVQFAEGIQTSLSYVKKNGKVNIKIQDTDDEDEETEDQVQTPLEAKIAYQQSIPMLRAMLTGFKWKVNMKVSGKIDEVSGFKSRGNQVAVELKGEEVLEQFDEAMKDPKKMEELLNLQESGQSQDSIGNITRFMDEPLALTFTPGEVLFDYNKEIQQAKQGYGKMIKNLKLDASSVATTAAPVAEKEEKAPSSGFKIAATSFQLQKTMYQPNKSYKLTLTATLDDEINQGGKGELLEAKTSKGKNILPKQKWDREIHHLSVDHQDKNKVSFDVKLDLPDSSQDRLEVVRGNIKYMTAGGTKDVPIGTVSTQKGSKWGKYEIEISSNEKSQWQKGYYSIQLKCSIPQSEFKEFKFETLDGSPIKLNQNGSGTSNNTITSLGFSKKGKFPDKIKVTVVTFDGIVEKTVPFEIKNVPVTGF